MRPVIEMPIWFIAIIVPAYFYLPVSLSAQTPESTSSSPPNQQIHKTISDVVIAPRERGLPWQVNIDLGTLEAGKHYEFSIDFKALFDINFSGTRTSCACHKFKVSSNSFQEEEWGNAKLSFKAVEGILSGKSGLVITFHQSGKEVGMFSLNYKLSGNLYLESSKMFLVRNKMAYTIAYSFSEPILSENLQVEGAKSFKHCEVGLDRTSGSNGGKIELLLTESMASDFDSGVIKLKDSVTGAKAECSVVFAKVSPVSIVPASLYLNQLENGGWESKPLLRVDSIVLEELNDDHPEIEIQASSSLLGNIPCKVVSLAKGIYRLEVGNDVMLKPKSPVASDKLDWTIKLIAKDKKAVKFNISTNVVIGDQPRETGNR